MKTKTIFFPFIVIFFYCTVALAVERPKPLRSLEIRTVIRVSDFGAYPNDGKNDWKQISVALKAMSEKTADGPVRVVFAPGCYNIIPDKSNDTHCFYLSGISGFEIFAEGCEFIVGNPLKGLFKMYKCDNGIIRGLSLDYSILPFTQGRIRNISVKDQTFDFVPDDGYVSLDEPNIFNATTRWGALFTADGQSLKDSVYNAVPVNNITSLENGSCRARTGHHTISQLHENDRMSVIGRYNGRPSFMMDRCIQISFIGVTIYASPAGGFVSHDSMFNVLDCSVIRKKGRLVSTDSDCVHVCPAEFGPWVERSTFEGQQDDAVNIKTELIHILDDKTDDTFLVAKEVRCGDRLRMFDAELGKMLGWFTVKSCKKVSDGFEIVTEQSFVGHLNCGEGMNCTMFFNDNKANKGFVLRNNIFRNSRRFGMLIQAVDGEILENHFFRTSGAAIILRNAADRGFGFVPRNIVIKGNHISNCGFDTPHLSFGDKTAPVMIVTYKWNSQNASYIDKLAPWQGIENIVFTGNEITAPGTCAVFLSGVKASQFKNNVFRVSAKDPIYHENVSDLEISGNVVQSIGKTPLPDMK